MPPRSASARICKNGRLSVPADRRRELGVEKDGVVNLTLDEEGLRIETIEQFVRRVQQMAREDGWPGKLSVDDFIAWKREEARREESEMNGGGK